MRFSPRTFGHHLLGASATATLQAWVMVVCVAVALSLLRIGQIAWHWPEGLQATASDLWAVLFQGARFDLKVCAAAAVLLWPVLWLLPARWHRGFMALVSVLVTLLGVLLALFLLVLTTKGTLRAMALGRQNVSVTTSQFLNDMVPNGVIALKFAWDARRESQNLSDPLLGLRRLGYATPMDAARALGLPVQDEEGLRRFLLPPVSATPAVAPAAQHKNL